MVVHTCNPSTQEAEAEDLEFKPSKAVPQKEKKKRKNSIPSAVRE
jgi:hypothetical protein